MGYRLILSYLSKGFSTESTS